MITKMRRKMTQKGAKNTKKKFYYHEITKSPKYKIKKPLIFTNLNKDGKGEGSGRSAMLEARFTEERFA